MLNLTSDAKTAKPNRSRTGRVINVTVTVVPHPDPDSAIDFLAKLVLAELVQEKENETTQSAEKIG